mgnify:CR=1 FL=1
MFFSLDDAFKQHREAKQMLLDVSRPVALIYSPFIGGQFIAFDRMFSRGLGRGARRRCFGM